MQALCLLVALATAGASLAAAVSLPEVSQRPRCLQEGFGFWSDQGVAGDGLAAAELQYDGIRLASQSGVPLAALGPEGWPLVLSNQSDKCACCRLCTAQNDYTIPSRKCKRWSHRAADGACRLFGPDAEGVRSVTRQNVTPKDQAWYSGSSEGLMALQKPEQEGQCLMVANLGVGGGGASGGLMGGGGVVQASPPPSSKPPPPSPPSPGSNARKPPPPSPPPSVRRSPPPSVRRSPPPRTASKSPPPSVRRSPPPRTASKSPPPAVRRTTGGRRALQQRSV